MSRLYNTFEFIGNIAIPKNADKFHKVNLSDSGWERNVLNFSVKESNTNSAFVELQGGYSKSKANKVITMSKGTENERAAKLEIPWEDRLKQETLNMVADFRKIVVDYTTDKAVKEKSSQLRYEIRSLEYKDELKPDEVQKLNDLRKELLEVAVDRHEFIHAYDAIVFLANTLENYKSSKFRLTGNVVLSSWNGNFYRRFEPTMIEIVEDETKNQLRATMDIFFTKESMDTRDFEKEKKVYINGYLMDYDNQAKKDVFFPKQFVLNATKLDMENEMHVKRLEFFKNKFDVKGKGVFHLQWLVNIFRGADKVEFTEKDLTPAQREAIEFGLNKLEDFEPKGGMLGETTEETRLVKPILMKVNDHNDFTNGAVETTYDADELDYVPVKAEAKKEEKSEATIPPAIDAELDDLFG